MLGAIGKCMLLMLWAVAISACFYLIGVRPDTLPEEAEPKNPAGADVASGVEVMSFSHRVALIGTAFFFNACITIAVNTLYIYSTQQALGSTIHFCIQFSLSIFRLLYTAVAFPLLSRPIRNAVDNVRFRFVLLSINNLLIPCMVTLLTSDACFQVCTCTVAVIWTPANLDIIDHNMPIYYLLIYRDYSFQQTP